MVSAKRIATALGLVLSCFQAQCAVVGDRIALRSDGLHAAVWCPGQGASQVALWHDSTDLVNVELPDAPAWVHPQIAFVGNNVVISDVPAGGVGPVTSWEYVLNGTNVIGLPEVTEFGDINSRMGCSCSLRNGGALFINFVTLGLNTPAYGFDISYRLPPRPPPPPGESSSGTNWLYKRFWFNNPAPGAVIALMSCDEMSGMVHVAYTFDGSGVIGLLVISVTNGIQVALQNDSFIGRDSSVAPSVEIPEICVVKDGKGLVFAYQAAESTFHYDCVAGSPIITGPTLFARVGQDLSVSKWCQLPWEDYHSHAVVAPWPRSDAMYSYAGKLQDCIRSWWRSRVTATGIDVSQATQGELRAFSSDGWTFTPETGVELTAMRPAVSIVTELLPRKLRGLVGGVLGVATVSWDNFQTGDVLEGSTDLKTWQTVSIGQKPPVDVAMSTDRMFFRVKR